MYILVIVKVPIEPLESFEYKKVQVLVCNTILYMTTTVSFFSIAAQPNYTSRPVGHY